MPIIFSKSVRLRLVNLLNGALSAARTLRQTGTPNIGPNAHWCETNGEAVFCGYDFNGAQVLSREQPNGTTFTQIQSVTPPNFIDTCTDGEKWYGLTSTQVRTFGDPLFTNVVSPAWNHGIAGPLGILHNGSKIGILAP